jgi:hypothetical protein
MPQFQEADINLLLKASPDAATAKLAREAALVKSLTAVLNASLQLAADPPRSGGQLALALAKKASAVNGLAATASGSQGLQVGQFMTSQTLKTMGLVKLAGMTPARASVTVTLAMAEKVVGAAGLAGFDKCRMAIASLSATTGVAGMSCFASGAFTMGIGCVVGAIAIAADAFNVYGQCQR